MKVAAFDFDGTTLFEHGMAAETVDAIRSWQDAGHLAVAATGKSRFAARSALDGSDLTFDYSVLFIGAAVSDRSGAILHSTVLDGDEVRRLVTELAAVDGIAVYGTRLDGRDVRFSSTVAAGATTSVLVDFDDIAPEQCAGQQFVGVPIWVPGDPDRKQRIPSWIEENFTVGCVVNQNFLDVVPVGTTKAGGLRWLGTHLGIPREQVQIYTFGDSWNDLSMHAIADRSFSFPWSPPEVQSATDAVIDSVAAALPQLA